MKQHWVRYGLGLAVLLVLLGHSARLYQIPLISHLDAIAYDVKLRLTMPQRMDDRVVILDIDEKSLAEVGRWPWGRDKLAALVDKLFDQYQIAVLGFDVVFAEPDDSSGLKTLESLAGRELKDSAAFHASLRDLRPQLDHDARFANSLQGRPVVLGFYLSSLAEESANGALPPPVLPEGTFQGRNIAFTHWTGHGGNLEEFQKTAGSGGHFNPLVDFDGVSRRVPMLAEYRGAYYEALSLAMVRLALGRPKVVPGFPAGTNAKTYGAMEWIDLPTSKGTLRIPVDENAASLVPYRGYRGSYDYISMADVLAGRVAPERLKGRIAIVGTTAPGLMDLRVTPVDNAYPGVEIHANLIAGMLDGSIKYKPAYVLGADVVLLLLSGGVMVFLLPLLSPFRATIVASIVLLFLLSVNFAFWQAGNLVLPLSNTVVLVIALYGMNMSWGYFVESRSKRQLTGLFGQYVPPELVEEMSRDPENYSMAGRKAELTVLFSDVRGFTTISEGLEPDQLAALMNEYLGAMTQVIRGHRGTLDKYIGDAIMAFWGAPVEDFQHARNAVLTALHMQEALHELNKVLVTKGWPELKIGVGVNTGTMTVGDMGSPVRQSYTVMGDAVNLGSRLEGITKQYGVGIIVGESTRELLKKEVVFRELDRVRVKGKDEPVGIYEPLGLEGQVDRALLDELKLWNQALRAYRSQDWDQAELTLMNLSRISQRYLYELYMQRIAHYRKEPPDADWDGVWKFETK
ncbi:CHASE2 domain-containing protein [Denitratisoma oestradiolicum]|uniref:Adenylate/guanylate cyclase with Chase sensor n=1 Tax=Denitratisoma oestradiolicum TaxID=311182 RepID=A0A6S6XRI9_9PROT|nr:adenylate/guanylate cyclase domain-containing protein [Denitratisoma oestradiolicum]TWO81379.1 adenylate/guanylate cyclase domain-containing protein [Denitratisoma oestradiolicum]CAB1368576.1 Adenylate/guanylate cyclase with Chase sensor [Denitratisoma oestradiolicum]